MSRPPKPFSVLKSEKKSHRTKEELNQRQQGEKALSTGTALKERPEVKNNKVAHQEFTRLNELLVTIEKNDAIYESIINRYCQMQAECSELVDDRTQYSKIIKELRMAFKCISEDLDPEERADKLIEFTQELARIVNGKLNIDKVLQAKRKMLFDIEKENIMTIAAALRSIPKKVDKGENPLLKALMEDG